jgi:hypothetical protein
VRKSGRASRIFYGRDKSVCVDRGLDGGNRGKSKMQHVEDLARRGVMKQCLGNLLGFAVVSGHQQGGICSSSSDKKPENFTGRSCGFPSLRKFEDCSKVMLCYFGHRESHSERCVPNNCQGVKDFDCDQIVG